MRGCWTGPGRGKEAECHMINFSESRVEVHREFCSNLGVACYCLLGYMDGPWSRTRLRP